MARRAVIMLVRAMRKIVVGGTKSLIVAPPHRVLVSYGELLTGHCQLRPKPATSSERKVLSDWKSVRKRWHRSFPTAHLTAYAYYAYQKAVPLETMGAAGKEAPSGFTP